MTALWRKIAAAVLAAAGLAVALVQLNEHYPVRHWLFWVYLQIWLIVGVWTIACVAGGHALVGRRRLPLPFREHLLFSFACGVLLFALGIFALGVVGGLRPAAFVLWPLVMIAAGGPSLYRLARRAARHIRHARRRPTEVRPTVATYAIFLFGALGVVALYLNILTPANIGYDSRWYHLGLAERYAATHTIGRFPEGWFPGALPQLSSLLYTWAFLIPGNGLFARIEIAAHQELILFLATLAGVSMMTRWLLGGRRTPLAWVAVFLFPGILVYDGTLIAAADHVLAFWAPALVLAAARFRRSWSTSDAFLLAAMAAGAALTKYQSLYLLVPLAVAAAVWTVFALRQLPARFAVVAPLGGAGLFLALTSIHWLKNLVWYGNPVYPWMGHVFRSRPWSPDVDLAVTLESSGFTTSGTFGHRVYESAKAMATFAFTAHDWPAFHGDWPVFGFLFTLLVPFLFVLRGAWRPRALAAASLAAVFLWYWTSHEDRYLQALVPWMAAVVAAIIWQLWRAGLVARISVASLVALQLIWGGDHYALPTHTMIGTQPLRVTMDLLADGFRGRFEDRLAAPSGLVELGRSLPKRAVVLAHDTHLILGLGAPTVCDALGTQGGLSYRRARSPREMWGWLRRMGVTHVMWPGIAGNQALSDEAVFYDFVTRQLANPRDFGGTKLAEIPTAAPPVDAYGPAVVLGCGVARKVALPEVDQAMKQHSPIPPADQLAALESSADFVLMEASCRSSFPKPAGFQRATDIAGWDIWLRRR